MNKIQNLCKERQPFTFSKLHPKEDQKDLPFLLNQALIQGQIQDLL